MLFRAATAVALAFTAATAAAQANAAANATAWLIGPIIKGRK